MTAVDGGRAGGATRVDWAGETFTLLPERALAWPSRGTLVVADVHAGKASSFRQAGVPVPRGATSTDAARLTTLIAATGATRLVILGDLLHDARGRGAETMRELGAWRERHAALEVLLVRGNHDRRAGDPPDAWSFRCVDEPHVEDGVAFSHDPACARTGTPTLAGHVHPAVVLRDRPRGRLRCACFHFAPALATLPAFGSFTGARVIRPRPGDRVFAVGSDAVVEVRGPQPSDRT
jgi:DNA ligase-associated metallophosphoesterase